MWSNAKSVILLASLIFATDSWALAKNALLGEMTYGIVMLGKVGEMSFGILKLGETSFGMLNKTSIE